MNDACLNSIDDIREFLQGNHKISYTFTNKNECHQWMNNQLRRFRYNRLSKGEKTVIKRYLRKMTGYSKKQLKRLIREWRDGTLIYTKDRKRGNGFARKYSVTDIDLLITTDINHQCPSGQMAKRILHREVTEFGNQQYLNISGISTSYIYHIRKYNRQYTTSPAKHLARTNPTEANIGTRTKPNPEGKPGFLRIDTVHQSEENGQKGVCHINIVDEVTQFEMVATVQDISEQFLQPVLKELLALFPFHIYAFHSDNGSEYINYRTAKLLNKLHIRQTKSRSRHSNDNALVESKNAAVVRKWFGYIHIPRKNAKRINQFNREFLNLYLNYHRPCAFPVEEEDRKGKVRKKYPQSQYMTPYEKLKSLPNATQYLKDGITFEQLDKIAYAESDNEFAARLQEARRQLFRSLQS